MNCSRANAPCQGAGRPAIHRPCLPSTESPTGGDAGSPARSAKEDAGGHPFFRDCVVLAETGADGATARPRQARCLPSAGSCPPSGLVLGMAPCLSLRYPQRGPGDRPRASGERSRAFPQPRERCHSAAVPSFFRPSPYLRDASRGRIPGSGILGQPPIARKGDAVGTPGKRRDAPSVA